MLNCLFLFFLCPLLYVTAVETTEPQKTATPSSEIAEAAPVVTVLPVEQTLSILKPDAVESSVIGEILEYFETAGLKVVASKMTRLSPEQVKAFYAAHKDKPFFNDLVKYMTSGPVVIQVLEGEDAIATSRRVMGATDPLKASPGTIRFDFGTDISRNAVHGSDTKESAEKEISFFFKSNEIFSEADAK